MESDHAWLTRRAVFADIGGSSRQSTYSMYKYYSIRPDRSHRMPMNGWMAHKTNIIVISELIFSSAGWVLEFEWAGVMQYRWHVCQISVWWWLVIGGYNRCNKQKIRSIQSLHPASSRLTMEARSEVCRPAWRCLAKRTLYLGCYKWLAFCCWLVRLLSSDLGVGYRAEESAKDEANKKPPVVMRNVFVRKRHDGRIQLIWVFCVWAKEECFHLLSIRWRCDAAGTYDDGYCVLKQYKILVFS